MSGDAWPMAFYCSQHAFQLETYSVSFSRECVLTSRTAILMLSMKLRLMIVSGVCVGGIKISFCLSVLLLHFEV